MDPDRLSETRGLFQVTEMLDLALTDGGQRRPPSRFADACVTRCDTWSCHLVVCVSIGGRRKQVYSKHTPKKRDVPPPQPFEPDEQFLDFVQLLDPLVPVLSQEALKSNVLSLSAALRCSFIPEEV
jgi:hypothetical protein